MVGEIEALAFIGKVNQSGFVEKTFDPIFLIWGNWSISRYADFVFAGRQFDLVIPGIVIGFFFKNKTIGFIN